MIYIIYKTIKLAHLKKLQILQNIFWLNFYKVNHSFLHLFLLLGEWVISFYLGYDDKNLGASFPWGETFSRNVNIINLQNFPTHRGIYTSLKENLTSILDRNEALKCILEANLEGEGW